MATKADALAADRLLKAAVREAVTMFRTNPVIPQPARVGGMEALITYRLGGDTFSQVESMLAQVCRGADLLLSERAA